MTDVERSYVKVLVTWVITLVTLFALQQYFS
jgi:hypothetical protein